MPRKAPEKPFEHDIPGWKRALEVLSQDQKRDNWRKDPVAWVEESLKGELWSKQKEILRAVTKHKLVAVQASHGVGKSITASRLVAYYVDNYDPGDFFIVTTSPTWAQVKTVLWRYIGQLIDAHDLPGTITQNCQWRVGNELVAIGRKPADRNEQGFQGIHARKGIIGIIDEASGVDDQIWNALDSMATTRQSRIIAIGNPDSVSSRFHKVCTGQEPNWHVIQMGSFDAPWFTGEKVSEAMAEGLVDETYVEDKKARWGEDSALYKIKVLGQFAELDETAVIPIPWIQAAFRRWTDWNDRNLDLPYEDREYPSGRTILGVDVGHLGADKTVIVTRRGPFVTKIEQWSKKDTVTVAQFVRDRLSLYPKSTAVVDAIGVGAGVVDQLRNTGHSVVAFVSSSATHRRDSTGSQRFSNARAAAWWYLREQLDPAFGGQVAIEPNDDLLRDLSAPRFEMVQGGRLKIELKSDVKKRLGHSPDLGDALVYAFWVEQVERAYPDGRQGLRGPVQYTPSEWRQVFDGTNQVALPTNAITSQNNRRAKLRSRSLFTGHF